MLSCGIMVAATLSKPQTGTSVSRKAHVFALSNVSELVSCACVILCVAWMRCRGAAKGGTVRAAVVRSTSNSGRDHRH